MKLEEAKKILNENGFIIESFFGDKGGVALAFKDENGEVLYLEKIDIYGKCFFTKDVSRARVFFKPSGTASTLEQLKKKFPQYEWYEDPNWR